VAVPEAARRGVVAAVFADDNRGIAALNHAAIEALREAMPGCSISMIPVTDPRDHDGESYAYTARRDADVELLSPPISVTPGMIGSLLALLRSLRLLFVRPGAGAPLAIRRVLSADLVVCRGGNHSFRDRRGLRGVLAMWLTLFPLALASRFRVPTAVLPSTVGPFRHWPSRALSQWVLRRTSVIMVRDGRSQRRVLAMGVDPARVVRIPDGVFQSRRPTMAESRALADRLGFGDVRFGAVTVRTIGARRGRFSPQEIRRLYEALAQVIRILLDRHVVDRIAVVLQIEGHNESDAGPAAEFVKIVNDPRVRLGPSGLSPDELIAFYGAAQFVIPSHLHSSIFSLVAGTPVFPLSILGEKVDGVYEDLGLQRFVVHRQFDPATLAETIAHVVANGEAVRTEIRQAVDAASAEAGRAVVLLRAASNGDRRTNR
jgi:polysaccharide pyruvyl transferase WcaK-like protein